MITGRSAVSRALLLGWLLGCVLTSVVVAQKTPPWKVPQHPFYNDPIGYARNLHEHYLSFGRTAAEAKAEIAKAEQAKAASIFVSESKTRNWLRGLDTYDKKIEAERKRVADAESTRAALEDEWRDWCELGLLGSPMPPLSAADETVVDTYLDRTTDPPVVRRRIVDRLEYNIHYFLEHPITPRTPAPTPAPPPTAGGGGGGAAFPKDPFNGLQVNYTITGAQLSEPSDGGPFEGWVRTFTGTLVGPTLGVSGSVTGCPNKDYPRDAHITVAAGSKTNSLDLLLSSDKSTTVTKPYDVSVPVPADATSGSITVTIRGVYTLGEERFVTVKGTFARRAPQEPMPAQPPTLAEKPPAGEQKPESLPPVLSRPVGPPAYITLPREPAVLIPAEGTVPEPAEAAGEAGTDGFEVPDGLPLTWNPGDRLVTEANSPALLIMPEGDRVILRRGSTLEFGSEGPGLTAGGAFFDVIVHQPPHVVSTPSARIRTPAGAYGLHVLPDGTTIVAAVLGEVRLSDAQGGGEVTVLPGSWSRIAPGRRASAPAPLTAELLPRYVGDLKLLGIPEVSIEPEQTPAEEPPAEPVEESAGPRLVATRATDNLLLGSDYPATDVRCSLRVTMEQPGTVLDTVGLGAAKRGSWALTVNPDGQVQFQVHDPGATSNVNMGGWHVLRSQTRLAAGRPVQIDVAVAGGQMRLAVDRKLEAQADLVTSLSRQPVYLGDFPGDQSFPANLKPARGLIGTMEVLYLGEAR
jgi:hypothetical protein